MKHPLLKFMKRSTLNQWLIGSMFVFISLMLFYVISAGVWEFVAKPLIGRNWPYEAVAIESPVKIKQLVDNPEYAFSPGESVTMLFNVKRKTLSEPTITVRLACSNGVSYVISNKVEVPPTSRSFNDEPFSLTPIKEGAGGICQYHFESTQKFKFLDQPRTQDIRYESVLFSVNNERKEE